MSVTSQVDKSGPFLITALPQTIPTGFPFQSGDELLVLDAGPVGATIDPATVLVLGGDYTVTGGNYNSANEMQEGSVIVDSGGVGDVQVGDLIVIMRNVPLNQVSSFLSTGPLTVKLLEQMGDKLATLSQQVNEVTTRALRYENFEFLNGTLSLTDRKGMLLGFSPVDGSAIYYSPTGGWAPIGAVNVLSYGAVGDGITDDLLAIEAAIATGQPVLFPSGYVFGTSAAFSLPANQTIEGAGTAQIKALAGFGTNYMLTMGEGSRIVGLTFDGTNMDDPTGAWLGVGTPVGSCIYIPGTAIVGVPNCALDRCTFQNFPSGPLFAAYSDDLLIRQCVANNCQTYTANETNACFETYECDRVLEEFGTVTGFAWKAYNIGNSTGSQLVGCKARGGVAGHASHYFSGNDNCVILGGVQTGGFGIKVFNSTRINIVGFNSYLSTGSGIYLQAVTDFVVSGCLVRQPTAKGIVLEGITGYGDLKRGVVQGCVVDYPTVASSSTQAGLYIACDAATVVDDVTIQGCTIRQAYFGIQIPSTTSGNVTRLRVDNCSIDAPVQYGVLGYIVSGSFTNNTVKLDAAFPAFFFSCSPSTTGDYLRVRGNVTTNANVAGTHYEIANGAGFVKYNVVDVSGNTANTGSQFCVFKFNNNTTDYIKAFSFNDNIGFNQSSASSVDITFNSTTSCYACQINRNTLDDGAGTTRNIALTNTSLLTVAAMVGNIVNSITNRPRNAYPFQGTGSPESVLAAPIGSVYARTDGGVNTSQYFKESGTGTTGWAAK